MNPPGAPPQSRFSRGRSFGRGGGGGRGYRPYYFFRRNGRVIPACGAPHPDDAEPPADNGWGTGAAGRWGRRGRGGRRGKFSTAGADNNGIAGDTTFMRPEHYAAPEDGLKEQCIAVEENMKFPGWKLYFTQGESESNSEVADRIKALQTHYRSRPSDYDLADIQEKCFFQLEAKTVTGDPEVMTTWPTLLEDMRRRSHHSLAIFGVAMHSVVTVIAWDAAVSLESSSADNYVIPTDRLQKIYVRPVGFVAVEMLTQVELADLDHLYCVRGSVAAIGTVEAAASWIAYKCPRCGQEQALRQSGTFVSRPYCCKRDGCLAKKGFVEQRSSPYTRVAAVQIIRLAELNLDKIHDWDVDLPEFLDVELRHDLVDSVYPGQEIVVTGILKRRPLTDEAEWQRNNANSTRKNNVSQVFIRAASVVDGRFIPHVFSQSDEQSIMAINSDSDSFRLLVHSVAPEVHGHELVKAGVLFSLIGGAGSQLHDDGEINVLLVGDPGIGKSHMLRMSAKVSGKGALMSGKRSLAGNNKLSCTLQGRIHHLIDSGALVVTSCGHCAVDDIDRLASQQDILLQAIQSRIVCLPYAGIFGSLSCQTAIVAAANSSRGHYDSSKTLTENIKISTSLLGEFHLVFVLFDRPDRDVDRSLTDHIRSLHSGQKKSSVIAARFALKKELNNSVNLTISSGSAEDDVVEVSEDNYDLKERLRLRGFRGIDEENLELVPPLMLKKFVAYARQKVKPLLTPEAAEMLKNFYIELKTKCNESNFIGSGQLEGLIRLSQARARIDFSAQVTRLHVRDVICVVRQCIADAAVGDYVDLQPSANTPVTNKSGTIKRFIQMLQTRSGCMNRRVFDFDELKDMARNAGISCGVTNLVEMANLQGYLLKKGPNLYEILEE